MFNSHLNASILDLSTLESSPLLEVVLVSFEFQTVPYMTDANGLQDILANQGNTSADSEQDLRAVVQLFAHSIALIGVKA